MKLIPVRPRNYRAIVMTAVEEAVEPSVFINKEPVEDFSVRGPITQQGIRKANDLIVKDGIKTILMFHDHPDEMGINQEFKLLADKCAAEGWLILE